MDYLILLYLMDVLLGLGIVSFIAGLILAVCVFTEYMHCEGEEFARKKLAIMAAVMILLPMFIPSKKVIYLAVGIEVTKDISNHPTAKKIIKVLDKYLDEELSDEK